MTPAPAIVHFLRYGRTPCVMRGVPGSWPPGNSWSDNWASVTCALCLAARLLEEAADDARARLAAAGATDANRYGGIQRGGSGAVPPLSHADARAFTSTLGLVMGALASMAEIAPSYLVYLTDLEAGRAAGRPDLLDGVSPSELRPIVEALLPITKVAIRLLKTEVTDNGPPVDGRGRTCS